MPATILTVCDLRRPYAVLLPFTSGSGNGNLCGVLVDGVIGFSDRPWILKNIQDMENYRIYCEESERAEIMSILRKYNDVVVDNVDSTSFGITVERDNPEAFFQDLLEEIDREVYAYRRERDSTSQ